MLIAKALDVTVMRHQEVLELTNAWWLYHIHATCRIPARYSVFAMLLEVRDDAKNDWYPETIPTTEHIHYGYAAHDTGHSGQHITFRACFELWFC